jgi:hypothetical protein
MKIEMSNPKSPSHLNLIPVHRYTGPFDAEALSGQSPPPSAALSCAVSRMTASAGQTPRLLSYSASDLSWTFTDPVPSGRPVLLRNAVTHNGQLFEVESVCSGAFQQKLSAICISRNVVSLAGRCLYDYRALQSVAFESDSLLREIGDFAFSGCVSLRSIAIPSLVRVCPSECFENCRSLGSVIFELPSSVATIEKHAFFNCQSLKWLFIPASVESIDGSALGDTGIVSIGVSNESDSLKVRTEFLFDFESRWVVWVIGSPERIFVPA